MPQKCIYLSDEDLKRVKAKAKKEKRSLSYIIRTLISEHLKD